MVLHYLATRFNLLPNSDVSEIAIAISYPVSYTHLDVYKRQP